MQARHSRGALVWQHLTGIAGRHSRGARSPQTSVEQVLGRSANTGRFLHRRPAFWGRSFGILGAPIYNPDDPVPNPVVGLWICGIQTRHDPLRVGGKRRARWGDSVP